MCRCKNHKVETVTNAGTSIQLTLTNSTDIGNLERFNLVVCRAISDVVTGDPIPVTATINSVVGVPLKNAFGQPLMSNVIPYGRTCGSFVMGGDTTTADASYVILKTPCYA